MPTSLFDPRRLLLKLNTTKRWWIPLALVAIIAVNAAGLLRPERYRSNALVLIRQPPIPDQRVRETFRLNDMLQTIHERIRSFSFLSEVAHKLNLDAGISPDSPQYEQLIERMRDSISLQTQPDFFRVTYSGYEPKESYNVTDTIVKQFIHQSSEYYNQKAQKNVQFLETQLRQETLGMKHAQDEIRKFKDAHINVIPEAQAEHLGRLSRLREEIQANTAQMEATDKALKRAQEELAATSRELTTEVTQTDTPEMRMLRERERELRLRLDLLQQVNGYTDEHWEVLTVRKQLMLIEDQKTSAGLQLSKEITTQPNPRYNSLKERITEFELKIDELQKHLIEQHADVTVLEAYLAEIPKHQDELLTLERNYRTAAEQVEYYRSQLNQAEKASQLEAQGMGPSFEIKDPPRIPSRPYSPNRVKIAAVSVVLGLASAFALILLLCFLDQSVRSVDEARQVLQMPVLGMVQRIVTPSQVALRKARKRRRIVGLGSAFVLLLIVGVVGYVHFREDILLGVSNLREIFKQR
jgi:polysaccharide chain length determinant protein (PEP-CTERM system associated)